MKPSVPLVVSVGLLVIDPSAAPVALLAVAGIQLITLAVDRISQIILHRRSHANARALVQATQEDKTSLTVTLGPNGELRLVRDPVETAIFFVARGVNGALGHTTVQEIPPRQVRA